MFDRDAREDDRTKPSETSDTTLAVFDALRDREGEPSRAHRLGRRAIENYLPRQTLRKWAAEQEGDRRRTFREAADVFFGQEMDDHHGEDRLRASFNMKKGLLRDAPASNDVEAEIKATPRALKDEELDPLYRHLSVQARMALARGFGANVAKRCYAEPALMEDAWFKASMPERERDEIVRSLLEML